MKKRTLKLKRAQYVILMIACLIIGALFLPQTVFFPLLIIWYIFFWCICEEVE